MDACLFARLYITIADNLWFQYFMLAPCCLIGCILVVFLVIWNMEKSLVVCNLLDSGRCQFDMSVNDMSLANINVAICWANISVALVIFGATIIWRLGVKLCSGCWDTVISYMVPFPEVPCNTWIKKLHQKLKGNRKNKQKKENKKEGKIKEACERSLMLCWEGDTRINPSSRPSSNLPFTGLLSSRARARLGVLLPVPTSFSYSTSATMTVLYFG
ncbi:hypothetical protein RHGRI_033910 [Rhododendron griersonianum]|uniref:Uncharacterized protein n=1 Tax=Rhododendron griersonianum TaxID=479676 RepID=A0AAV6HYI5_9ERIC|nr:hypothetical protein RHGRI_033910 [Rhododendron griersonianum]